MCVEAYRINLASHGPALQHLALHITTAAQQPLTTLCNKIKGDIIYSKCMLLGRERLTTPDQNQINADI